MTRQGTGKQEVPLGCSEAWPPRGAVFRARARADVASDHAGLAASSSEQLSAGDEQPSAGIITDFTGFPGIHFRNGITRASVKSLFIVFICVATFLEKCLNCTYAFNPSGNE